MIYPFHSQLSIRQQCQLLGVSRAAYYYEPAQASADNLLLMRLLDEEHTRHPYKGVLKMQAYLRDLGHDVNVKRVRRLLRLMGLMAIYPKKRLSSANTSHKKYPYLLTGLVIERPNHVWSTDITYVRLAKGFLYLVAIMDWYSRYVLSWRLSNSLESSFCLEALEDAFLFYGFPEIFNSDQGVQFTSHAFTGLLSANGVKISMDGKGRALDNIFIERLWRSLKYEAIYLNDYQSATEAKTHIKHYWEHYNFERHHQHLGYKKPAEIYFNHVFPLGYRKNPPADCPVPKQAMHTIKMGGSMF